MEKALSGAASVPVTEPAGQTVHSITFDRVEYFVARHAVQDTAPSPSVPGEGVPGRALAPPVLS